jgi:hypothetical protein
LWSFILKNEEIFFRFFPFLAFNAANTSHTVS